jgi:hypothetical protein
VVKHKRRDRIKDVVGFLMVAALVGFSVHVYVH